MIDKRFPPTVKDLGLGILCILINTVDKWTGYQINQETPEDGCVEVTFFPEDDGPDTIANIEVSDEFNWLDYQFTSSQEKDQITIVCIPKELIINGGESSSLNFFLSINTF